MICRQPINRRLSTGRDRIDSRVLAGVSSKITFVILQARETKRAERHPLHLQVALTAYGPGVFVHAYFGPEQPTPV
jgi:hypothetical protein